MTSMLVEQQLNDSLGAWFLIEQVLILLIERENAQAQKRPKQELRDPNINYSPDCVCKGVTPLSGRFFARGGLTDSPLHPFRYYKIKSPMQCLLIKGLIWHILAQKPIS